MTAFPSDISRRWRGALVAVACAYAAALLVTSCSRSQPQHRAFATPEDAAKALAAAVKAGNVDEVLSILGPDAKELVASADLASARRNRQVFTVAFAERWRLSDERGPRTKTLVIGNEDWPFPIPIEQGSDGWRFNTAAGKEEVLDRRIGRNELAVIRICRTYVAAQRLYAEHGHDGRPAGIFAQTFRSDPGKQNGLYWPPARGQKRSPLGDLVAQATAEGRPVATDVAEPAPFHGYYFKILTGQGPDARGGAKDYVVDGAMSGGFALVAWPAQYDVTGVMTFIVSHDAVVREKDLGATTDADARVMRVFNPDTSWASVQ